MFLNVLHSGKRLASCDLVMDDKRDLSVSYNCSLTLEKEENPPLKQYKWICTVNMSLHLIPQKNTGDCVCQCIICPMFQNTLPLELQNSEENDPDSMTR